jgi:4,5:9,10-diseco-3-hydroxy-5,9,17-trioxoandrosta-1(10),2-diene-4-oate hydrolase
MQIVSLNKKRVLICGAAAVTVILGLTVMGFVGTASKKRMSTTFRSEVGARDPSKRITLDGVSIAYSDTGSAGPVVVCLHAIGHGSRDYDGLSRRLSPGYRVIAIDFPAQGNSGFDLKPASGTRYAQLLGEFVSKLDLHEVTLIGNSIGGAAAIRYTNAHPDRVRALVLCDSGGLGPASGGSRVFVEAFVQFFAAGRRGAFWFPKAFDWYYRRVLLGKPAWEERNRIVRAAYEIAPTLEQAWRSFADPNENVLPMLPRIKCPVLLAWARQDFVIPLRLAKPSFDAFPKHRLEVFEGGHAAFLEDPDRFENCLRNFLNVPRAEVDAKGQ